MKNIQTPRSTKIKQFVQSWNFNSPDWDKLPSGFPDCDASGLTSKQDKHLYEAIKTAWIISTSQGKQYIYTKTVKKAALGLAIIVILISGYLVANLTLPENNNYSRAVSAATISAGLKNQTHKIIESTKSAILKK